MARRASRVREIYRLFYQFYQDLLAKIQVNYVRSASLPIKPVIKAEQVQQYQLPDKVDVYYANSNFLKSKGFKLPDNSTKKVILMPASDKGQEGKNQFLGKSIAYLSLRYEDQQSKQ